MKRPLLWAFFITVCGVLLTSRIGPKAWLGAAGLVVITVVFLLGRKKKLLYLDSFQLGVVCTTMIFSILRGGYDSYKWEENYSYVCKMAEAGQTVTGTGTIKNITENDYTYSIEAVKCSLFIHEKPQECGKIILTISKPTSGQDIQKSNNQFYRDNNSGYHIGERIKFQGSPQLFAKARNEGNFNEAFYAYGEGRLCRIYEPTIEILKKANWWHRGMENIKKKLSYVYSHFMAEADAGIALAMVTGDKTQIAKADERNFYAVGVGHILAISGLHLSILGMGVYRLLTKFRFSLKSRSLFCAALTFVFSLFTGSSVSALRAFFMFVIVLIAGTSGRKYDLFSALSGAGVLLLLANPHTLFSASFQYSFAAMAGVGTGQAYLRKTFKKIHPLFSALAVSISAWLFTLPLTLYYNFEVSWIGIFLNLLVIPLMTPVLLSVMLGGIVGSAGVAGVQSTVSHLLCWTTEKIFLLTKKGFDLLRLLCCGAKMIPGSNIITGQPHWGWCLLFFVLILWILYRGMKDRRHTGLLMIPILVAALMYSGGKNGKEAELTMLDVGQGDGLYFCDGKKHHFFLDGGSSDVTGVGTYRILPFLKSRGITGIDGWFVSHCDKDHISGLMEVLEEGYCVKKIYFYQGIPRDGDYQELLQLAVKNHAEICYLKQGSQIETKGLSFTCMNLPLSTMDKNEQSLVLLTEYKKTRVLVLLAGDISQETEGKLVKDRELEKVSVWKATHHGSDKSNSMEILEEMKPEIVLISYGEGNVYGHPGKEAMERLQCYGKKIFSTALHGQITLKF